MKRFLFLGVATAIALFLGYTVGWRVEHRRAQRREAEMVQRVWQGMESFDAERAARAVRAIEAIESGEGRKALQLLRPPIAEYYSLYAEHRRGAQGSNTLAMIEDLARTNQLVAAWIAEASTNARTKTP